MKIWIWVLSEMRTFSRRSKPRSCSASTRKDSSRIFRSSMKTSHSPISLCNMPPASKAAHQTSPTSSGFAMISGMMQISRLVRSFLTMSRMCKWPKVINKSSLRRQVISSLRWIRRESFWWIQTTQISVLVWQEMSLPSPSCYSSLKENSLFWRSMKTSIQIRCKFEEKCLNIQLVFVESRFVWRLVVTTKKSRMLFTIKLILIGKPKSFACILTLSLTGNKEDGSSSGLVKTLIQSVTVSQERKKIKATVLDIWKWRWDHCLFYTLTKSICSAIMTKSKQNSIFTII